MGVKSRILLLLLYLVALHGAAIFIFTSGFLLTRTELPNVSSCSDVPGTSSGTSCWTAPGVKRVVILLIDALRFDFVASSEHFPGEAKPWMNKLAVLQRLVKEENAKVFKYIADPPTTTLQRLKGLTTGGLPTFIDVGNSFGAPAIVEDNLILQLAQNGKRVVMMGDDTWVELFPKHFSEAYPFPSFNVKDLHTVDNGVISTIFPKLKEENWDVLIGHFLGVDHVGHIFGVESPLMVDKLEQYNNVIEQVVSELRDQEGTMLIVMGDHGQTLHGDHGGGSPEEVETALFAMMFGKQKSLASSLSESQGISTLPQLDFAATLATLIGVPIPFGSVGRVNSELFSLAWPLLRREALQARLEHYRDVLRVNGWQVKRYLERYTKTALKGIPLADLTRLNALYEASLQHVTDSENENISRLEEQISRLKTFLNEAAALARSQWTQFGDLNMAVGLMLLLSSVMVHVVAVQRLLHLRDSPDRHVQSILPRKVIIFSLTATIIPGLLGYVLPTTRFKIWLLENLLSVTLGLAAFGSVLGYLTGAGIKFSAPQVSLLDYARNERVVAGGIFVILHAASLLSNSFIMEEGYVASFFLATIGVIYLRYSFQSGSKVFQAILFLIVNRLLAGVGLSGIVKDTMEAVKEDTSSTLLKTVGIDAVLYTAPLMFFSWLAIRHVYRSWHRENLCLMATILAAATFVLVTLHWFMSDVTDMKILTTSDTLREFVRIQLPRLVYICTLLSTGMVCLDAKMPGGTSSCCRLTDAVYALLSSWSGCIILLLGRRSALVIFLTFLEAWCLREFQFFTPAQPCGAHWNFLALLTFFCTNHRCTFDGLRYPAAFIGFDNFNLFRQGALLAIDTYGASHILPAISLPVLVVDHSREKDENSALDMGTAYLSFGLVRSIATTFSTICVTIQRRHLMVWGLFAPKYVFDAIGLLLTDLLFLIVGSLYFSFLNAEKKKSKQKET